MTDATGRAPLRLIVFPGGFNWPVWVAQDQGFFAAEGLDVEVVHTPTSVFQFEGLIGGDFDLAITLFDNVLAYGEGQGEVPLTCPDLVALAGADTRSLPTLVTLPHIRSYDDLRGQTLAVDAKRTGYAIVLYAMLEAGGLAPGQWSVESAGGVQQRFEAMLRKGPYAGALFNSPFEGLLVDQGLTRLDTAARVVQQYQGHVIAGRQSWIRTNTTRAVGFLRAFIAAVTWVYRPENKESALRLYLQHQPSATPDAAETAYGILFHPVTGFPRDGDIPEDAAARVAALRERHGIPQRALSRPWTDYLDLQYLQRARANAP